MFDNEIDWVTGLEELRARREARERRKIPNMFEYKAEHKQLSSRKDRNSGKCSIEECL